MGLDDTFRSVGMFIVNCADLDLAISSLAAVVLNMDDGDHETVIHSIDLPRKMQLIKSVAKTSAMPFMKQVLKRVEKAEKLLNKRTTVATGVLREQDGELVLVAVDYTNYTKNVSRKTLMIKVSALQGLTRRVDKLTDEMNAATDSIRDQRQLRRS